MKKAVAPAVRRKLVDYAEGHRDISLRRACELISICDSVYRYRRDPHLDDEVVAALQEVSERYPAHGFSKLLKVLRRRGRRWNHKRVHRLYCELNLNKRRRGKKPLPIRNQEQLGCLH